MSEKIGRLKREPKAAKAVRKANSSGAAKTCAKHPGFERDKQDRCKQCARDYAREWAQKKKAAKFSSAISERRPAEMRSMPTSKPNELAGHRPRLQPEAAVAVPIRRKRGEKFGDEIEYSKPITCPKCHAIGTRFSRPEEFNRDTDSWTCLKNGCQVRIAHIVLSIDRGYEPDAA